LAPVCPLPRIQCVRTILIFLDLVCAPETQDRRPVRAVAPIYIDLIKNKSVFTMEVCAHCWNLFKLDELLYGICFGCSSKHWKRTRFWMFVQGNATRYSSPRYSCWWFACE
jgi:hypothetical protein